MVGIVVVVVVIGAGVVVVVAKGIVGVISGTSSFVSLVC